MDKRKNSLNKSVDRKKTQLWGAPNPQRFKDTAEGKALTKAARIHFTNASDQNRLMAVEKLALEYVLNDPLAARAFAVNPDEYLRQMGFTNVKLDLNSQEVRAAMAMGDPRVKEAANRGDVTGFIDAVMAQGITPSSKRICVCRGRTCCLVVDSSYYNRRGDRFDQSDRQYPRASPCRNFWPSFGSCDSPCNGSIS